MPHMTTYCQTLGSSYLLYLALDYASNLPLIDSNGLQELEQVSNLISYLKTSLEMKETQIIQSKNACFKSKNEMLKDSYECILKLDVNDFIQSYSQQHQYSKLINNEETPTAVNFQACENNITTEVHSNVLFETKENTTSYEQLRKSVSEPKVNQKSIMSVLKRTRSESSVSVQEQACEVSSSTPSKKKIRKSGKKPAIRKKVTNPHQSTMQFKFNRWMFHTVKP